MSQVEYEFSVEWGDCDPAGIVFYPNYFRWFDVGTHKLMSAAGADQRISQKKFGILGAALLSSSCEFLKVVTYGNRLLHRIRVSEWSDRNFIVLHSFLLGHETVAEGAEKRVCLVREPSGKIHSVPIPPEFRKAIESVTGV